tara:strand:+ start:930 stop:1145 length:216 start_codon:yes stop_codon:yes gene_type:complete
MGKAWKRIQHWKRIRARQASEQAPVAVDPVKEVKKVAEEVAPEPKKETPKKETKTSYRTKKVLTPKKKVKK